MTLSTGSETHSNACLFAIIDHGYLLRTGEIGSIRRVLNTLMNTLMSLAQIVYVYVLLQDTDGAKTHDEQ